MIYCHPYPQGYEADAPFNTNNGGTYLGPVLHWSSNFDARSFDYLDTNFRNEGFHVWTVGIASTTWLRSGVLYHTHIGTANGSTSTDDGEIYGQVMQRFPSDCFTKWCMWPRDTKIFIYPWDYRVPHQSFITLDTT